VTFPGPFDRRKLEWSLDLAAENNLKQRIH